MTPVVKHFPGWKTPILNPGTGSLPDYASGIRNADQMRQREERESLRVILAFFYGALAGMILLTGALICLHVTIPSR